MTPSLGGLSHIVKKKKKGQNIHAFNNVRKCTSYHNVHKSHEYIMTAYNQVCLELKCISTLFLRLKISNESFGFLCLNKAPFIQKIVPYHHCCHTDEHGSMLRHEQSPALFPTSKSSKGNFLFKVSVFVLSRLLLVFILFKYNSPLDGQLFENESSLWRYD